MLLEKSILAEVDTSKPYYSDASESSEYSDSEEGDNDGFVAKFAKEYEKGKAKDCHFLLHYDFDKFSTAFVTAVICTLHSETLDILTSSFEPSQSLFFIVWNFENSVASGYKNTDILVYPFFWTLFTTI